MVIVNSQGLIQLVNAQTEKLFGYSRAELIGQRVEILVPSRYQDRHAADREGYARSPHARSMGAGWSYTAAARMAPSSRWKSASARWKQAKARFISSAIRDVTERKKTEEALREKDEKLRLLIRGVKDYAILMLDPEGRVTTWSEGAERIKGYRAEEIIGEHFSKFYTPEAIAQGKPARELKIAAAEGRFEEEGWRVGKDGSRFWANVVVTPLRDKTGRLRGFGKVTRDITERKRAAEEAELQRNELARIQCRTHRGEQGTGIVQLFRIARSARAAAPHRRLRPHPEGRTRIRALRRRHSLPRPRAPGSQSHGAPCRRLAESGENRTQRNGLGKG